MAWYADDLPAMRAGERWQLLVRGKRPNGFMNPNGFDYEQWLFSQRIGGSGYVRISADNQRLLAAAWWQPDNLRQYFQERIATALQGSAMTGLGVGGGLYASDFAGAVGGVSQYWHDSLAGDFGFAYHDGGGVGSFAGMGCLAAVSGVVFVVAVAHCGGVVGWGTGNGVCVAGGV
ncbi:MAG: hypothetical protein BWK73_47120 [Thiothrix lacustris]|uniref:DUF4131 domain-containing protein n=1 Tax=Thiothrix lacustris TaxID=525917 RepID=A0A1Y1QA17_9GAMM|nr:MAG: hypothetical protein BWK73_47120 [Thiothrix lacustris]